MAERFRVGIVGAGRIAGLDAATAGAATHAGAICQNASFELGGVCDVHQHRARALAEQWGGRSFSGVGELIAAVRPDAIVVSTPDSTHAAIACEVLASATPPRLLIIEKPPVVSRGELVSLLQQSKSSHATRTIVNLTRRFDHRHRLLANDITRGAFGGLIEAVFTYYGGWFHNGIHAVDTLRLLLGGDFRVIASTPGAIGRPGDPCRDVDLEWTAVPSALIKLRGFDESAFQLFELELRFTDARVRLEDFGYRISVEHVRTNAAGERELQRTATINESSSASAMAALYSASARYLSGDVTALDHACIDTVTPTMQVLFDAA